MREFNEQITSSTTSISVKIFSNKNLHTLLPSRWPNTQSFRTKHSLQYIKQILTKKGGERGQWIDYLAFVLYMLCLIESLTNYLQITRKSNEIQRIIRRLNETNQKNPRKKKTSPAFLAASTAVARYPSRETKNKIIQHFHQKKKKNLPGISNGKMECITVGASKQLTDGGKNN